MANRPQNTFRSMLAGTAVALLLGTVSVAPNVATAQVTAFKQAVAEAAWDDPKVGAFYRENNYQPIWTGSGEADRSRRAALLDALSDTSIHALPSGRYDVPGLVTAMRAARTTRDLGLLEVRLSHALVQYARDVQSGILVPLDIDPGLVRDVQYRDPVALLNGFVASSDPVAYMMALPPQTREYRALAKARLQLERLVASGGWGEKVPGGALKPGASGASVVALRDRLVRMGYLNRSATRTYDTKVEAAVAAFQAEHGMEADGVAGKSTIAEINVPAEARLRAVTVAMERERWLNRDLGDRHVIVNLADFHAKIVDHGAVTFQTRSVVGKTRADLRTPEFSDTMEHMIINPSWHVPRSIIAKEYLPALRNNPNAAGHLIITDSRGRRVDRSAVDFSQYSSRNFPFDMRQPPGGRNALGLVKFMFPNKHNIYLHDTPAKSLFSREVRAYSHGCIRLQDPFDFAYALLARQESDPKGVFQSILGTGKETKVELEQPLPVHLIYRTAFTTVDGRLEYRRDIYGRDADIWKALEKAGVALVPVQG